jgi:hypothetical protein
MYEELRDIGGESEIVRAHRSKALPKMSTLFRESFKGEEVIESFCGDV